MNTVKLEVEISLGDFFDTEADKNIVFKDALQSALLQKLNDHEFVQKNIAYWMFSHFRNEIFKSEMDKIEHAIREKIEEFKAPDRWDVHHNDTYLGVVNRAIKDMDSEIYSRTQKLAKEFSDDDGRDYNSLYGRVADAMVDKVFEHFVTAMTEKAIK